MPNTPQGTNLPEDPLQRPLPAVWDSAAAGGQGDWDVVTPSMLAGQGPLASPSSNIARTSITYPGGAVAVLSGACSYGFFLCNDPDSADRMYYGKQGVTASSGDLLEPGERAWVPVSDSGSVYVVAAGAGVFYRGVRY